MNETLRTAETMAGSGISFGTSGARGLVEDFTPQVCAAFTAAFIAAMRSDHSFERIAIGTDLRPSSPAMASACSAAAQALGVSVEYCGHVPTPALAYYAANEAIPAIMVTGSHIPFDRNGIKFYRPDGEISKGDEQRILTADLELALPESFSLPTVSDTALAFYQSRYLAFFPDGMLADKRIGVYQHSSVARDLLIDVLSALGADVVALERTDAFVPIDTEAVSDKDQEMGYLWASKYGLDAIVSTDGDADRPLIADENGRWLRGDIVGLLTASSLAIPALAVPVSCNSAIERSGCFDTVVRTRIGSPYVIEAMNVLLQSHPVVAGFEANGGFLLASDLVTNSDTLAALPTRDALLPILSVLKAAHDADRPISALLQALPQRYTASDRLQDFPSCASEAIIKRYTEEPGALLAQLGLEVTAVAGCDMTDGLRITAETGAVIHLRPSGNAPELRCYVESDSTTEAEALLGASMALLETLRVDAPAS